jgi:hypothetical protein
LPHCPQFRTDSAAPHELQNLPLAAAPQAGHVLGEAEVTKVLASSEMPCGSKVTGEYRDSSLAWMK